MLPDPAVHTQVAKPITSRAVRWASFQYVLGDMVASGVAWTALYIFRKRYLELAPAFLESWVPARIVEDGNFLFGLLFVPMFWVGLYGLSGMHSEPFRRHRSQEVGQVLWVSLVGALTLFFVLILDDQISTYTQYYQSLLVLLGAQITAVLAVRLPMTTRTVKRVHRGEVAFNSLIVGCNEQATDMVREIRALRRNPGFRFVGFVGVGNESCRTLEGIPCLGTSKELSAIVRNEEVEEVILAMRSSDHGDIEPILNELEGLGVGIKIVPDIYDILSGSVRMQSLFGAPLIAIRKEIMPAWQVAVKRAIDVVASLFALLLLSPLLLLIAIGVKLGSSGPV